MENEIITIYENAKGKSDTYQVDEFGPYVPAKEPEMNANSSWQNYDFCVNCGRKGHKTSECKDPTFDDMREQLNEISTDPNGNTPEKREQLFGEILKKSQNS
ncbi:hypothetical protein TRFO_22761 [Tritrichomonas foetus]|uniref:CCHC-type domain-containing protein n=1 Tax=Tritrichomonas foetus TaxID=1144522 RepID=A0A1J4KB81_9EUKA|nr:hypothetical protein TRFO_22761 [Tritrichomonas foetus]|eukprot:OHT08671.1 hypothetical protein TRFO_22761 [Tritrichomonas foetus]